MRNESLQLDDKIMAFHLTAKLFNASSRAENVLSAKNLTIGSSMNAAYKWDQEVDEISEHLEEVRQGM